MDSETEGDLEKLNNELSQAQAEEQGDQYLTFFMAGEEFGVDILAVREIRGWEPITAIPNSPAQVLGFTNLRGTVAPIIDLRLCFGVERAAYGNTSVVIIMSVHTEKSDKIMGIVVDAVSDVYNFSKSNIQPSPELSQTKQAQYVKGLGSTEDKMVILLELTEQLIADSEVVADQQFSMAHS
jgi:purine-binding chemotaxis protein CheW